MVVETIEKPVEQLLEQETQAVCTHHWVIEPPEGPISRGVCKKCGEEKEFNNYFTFSTWENQSSSSLLKQLGINYKADFDDSLQD